MGAAGRWNAVALAVAAMVLHPPVATGQVPSADPQLMGYYPQLSAACPARPVESWLPVKPDRWDREHPRDFVTDFDTKFKAVYAMTPPVGQLAFAATYRDCLVRAEGAVRASNRALMTPARDGNCADCSILMSPLALQGPRLQLLQGLTYLLPETLAEQDWRKAAETIRAAALSISTTQQRYAAVASAANRERIARREASRERAMLFGALLSGMAAGVTNDRTVISNTMQIFQAGQVEHDRKIAAMRANAGALFRAPGNRVLGDDGVRVTVPRIRALGTRSSASGTILTYRDMGAIAQAFPLEPIVQVIRATSTCTGSFVGPRLILTNRHCVIGTDGKPDLPTHIEWRYFASAYTGQRVDPGIGEKVLRWKVVNAVYPDRDHESDFSADWALLETDTPSTVGFLGVRDPATIPDFATTHIAVAGFSGDLNDGRYVTMDWGCPIVATPQKAVLRYGCRTFPGSSGSPVFIVDRPGMRRIVVGVNSRGYKGTAEGLKTAAADPEMFRNIVRMRAEQGVR